LQYPAVKRTLQPYSKEAWTNWKEFFMLGLPGTIMLCSEWWAYEILAVFASILGTTEVASQTIILQTASLAFMVPLGMGVACASLVGNSLGAGKKQLAIKLGKLSIGSIFVLEIGIGIIMILFGSFFVDMFTNDPEVIKVSNRAIPFLSVFCLVDGLQGVCSGVLRGAGKQFIGAVANVIAFYAIGLPMAWFFCFTIDLGVNGLMLGISTGTIFQVSVLVTLIFIYEKYVYADTVVSDKGDFQRLRSEEDSTHGIVMNKLIPVSDDERGYALAENNLP
jgi:MATE family multidrug resistance protein